MRTSLAILATFAVILGTSCSDDSTEADKLGIGAACATTDDCADNQECLTQFKGGYCGFVDCKSDANCPQASACVAHDDGERYCFRVCSDKAECNANRSADNEANCSASVTFVETTNTGKACVPPTGH